MSFTSELQGFVSTVETDIRDGVVWVENETGQALQAIWGVAKPIFVAMEPQVISALLAELTTFLEKAAGDVIGGTPAYIAETFLATLRDTGHVLLPMAEKLGMDLLTVLAGLAKNALPKVG